MANGNDRGHAQYAPSSAHRWMVCAASVKATMGLQNYSSKEAAEGTVAHHILELALNEKKAASYYIGDIIEAEVGGKPTSFIVTREMADAVQIALDYLHALMTDAEWHAEKQVTLATFGAPACYGTLDFRTIIRTIHRVVVVDYKHGAGVTVEVDDNPQLKIYGLATLLELQGHGITHVQTTIIQPRKPHHLGPIRSQTYTVAELMDFGVDVLEAIDRCEQPTPAFTPGEHCKWCGIEDSCAARIKAINSSLPVAIDENGDDVLVLERSDSLTVPQQEELLQQLEGLDIEGFVKSLRAALHKYAEDGGTLKHYKLVPKRGSRVYLKSEDETAKRLTPIAIAKGKTMLDLYDMSLKSPAEIEKVIGKGHEARKTLAGLTASVSSGTNLVPVTDSRPVARISAEDEFDALTPDD